MIEEEKRYIENENIKPHSWAIEKLKECFPSYFNSDGSFDFDRLKETLNRENIEIGKEGYRLEFLGREYANFLTSMKTETLIEPDIEHNKKPENINSENMYIVGDNLDALKHLRDSYSRQIKCIYIDPPYNTGSDDFVYSDRFGFSKDDLILKLSIDDEKAERLVKLQGNSSDSAWLTFMYPRLTLARDLLTDDGVMFISIDDNEQANLKILCDEIFGQENFVCEIPWQSRASIQNDTDFSVNHEYIVVYAKIKRQENVRLKSTNVNIWKRKDSFVFKPLLLEKNRFSNPDNDPRGLWKLDPFDAPHIRPNLTYEIINPNTNEVFLPPQGRCWRTSKEQYEKYLNDNRIVFGLNGEGKPSLKVFYNEKKNFGSIDNSWFSAEKVGTATNGTKELYKLMDKKVFDSPKPLSLIEKLLNLSNLSDNDIILDFFSGSATTAHAVMELNAEDGGRRKFIMVQLPEEVKKNSEAEKSGYKTIDQIGMERIRRAGEKIKKEHPDTNIDCGFRKFILKDTYEITPIEKIEEFEETPNLFENNFYENYGLETLLATWINYDGYGLLEKPEEIDLKGYTAYRMKDHLYFITPGFSNENLQELIKLYTEDRDFNPKNIVVFGYNMDFIFMEALNNVGVLKNSEKDLKVQIRKRY